MKTREFRYSDWVKQRPAVQVDQKRRLMLMGYAMTVVLAVLAVACLIAMVQLRQLQLQLLAGLIIMTGAAVLMFRKADANRRSVARATGTEVSEHGPYPLSVSDTEIHFPESFEDPEETWPLEGTVVRQVRVTKQDILALSHPGKTARHFYARALVEPLSEVQDEIESRQARLAPKPEPEAEPTPEADA